MARRRRPSSKVARRSQTVLPDETRKWAVDAMHWLSNDGILAQFKFLSAVDEYFYDDAFSSARSYSSGSMYGFRALNTTMQMLHIHFKLQQIVDATTELLEAVKQERVTEVKIPPFFKTHNTPMMKAAVSALLAFKSHDTMVQSLATARAFVARMLLIMTSEHRPRWLFAPGIFGLLAHDEDHTGDISSEFATAVLVARQHGFTRGHWCEDSPQVPHFCTRETICAGQFDPYAPCTRNDSKFRSRFSTF